LFRGAHDRAQLRRPRPDLLAAPRQYRPALEQLARPGRRAGEPGRLGWLTTRFSFADDNGATVQLSAADVLDSAAQLHYVYDDRPVVTVPPPIVVPVTPHAELIGATEETVAVAERVTVPLVVPDSNRALFADVARRAAGVFLTVENIEAAHNPGLIFDVLLNQPEGADPEPHRVGAFTLFGVERMNELDHRHGGASGMRHTFEIGEVVKALAALDLWSPDGLTVTIEPVPPLVPPGEAPPSLAEFAFEPVRVGRISLFAVERDDLVS